MRTLILWLLLSGAGAVLAQPEYYVKVLVTPPEAQFSVRHSKGVKVPGGPEPGALVPSGGQFRAGLIEGERGIVINVRHPGYEDFEQKFSLAPKREYWSDASNGWSIPIELRPVGLWSQIRHEFRFHPLFPFSLVALLALLPTAGIWSYARKAAQSRQREQEARAARQEARRLREELDTELVGKQVGDYHVLKKLGEGGFAEVFLVNHNDYGDEFAMKILKRGTFDAQTVQRMGRELEIGRTLVHPNLVRIVAFGDHRGAPYLVMDYVKGVQLTAIVGQTPVALETVQALFAQMLEGVAYAHTKGIIHRDLKPENMILGPTGVLKILDFGVAKPIEDEEKITKTGEAFGTPAYMSPEQLRGKADLRTDIYALGVILFEMVTGRLPFPGGEPMEIMAGHLFKPAPRMGEVIRGISAELESLCQDMLIKDPEQRIQPVEEVQRRFRELLEKPDQVSARPDSRP